VNAKEIDINSSNHKI